MATQVLSEAFRSHGLDGVFYKSFLGDGKNLALFDLTAAELLNCGLQRTDKVKYEFSQADNPYYIARHYPEIQKSLDLQAQQQEEDTRNGDTGENAVGK